MEERPIEDETTELAPEAEPVEPAEALEPTEAAPESNALDASPAEDQSEAPAEAEAVPAEAEAAPAEAEAAPAEAEAVPAEAEAAPESAESAVAAPKEPAPEAAAAKKAKVKNAVMIGVIVALIVVLLPLLIINLTLIIKGSLNPDMPPDLFGTAPLAVTTDAMAGEEEGCFSDGALIFVKLLEEDEKESLKEGDVITFRSEELFVTYRITEVVRGEDGSVHSFRAIGDQDAKEGVNVPLTVSPENVIGVVTGSVAGLGGFAMFLQTPVGVLVFVGIPVVAYLIFDISRIALSNKRAKAAQGEKLREKDEEIARLKAMVGEATAAAESTPALETLPEVLEAAEEPEEE